MTYPPHFQRWLDRMAPEVRARVIRLNPTYDPGTIPRGYHRTQTVRTMEFSRCLLSKRWIIDRIGREAWDFLRKEWPECIIKDGRRAYLRREAYEDQTWKFWRKGGRRLK